MKKRFWAISVVLAVCLGSVMLAGEKMGAMSGKNVNGSITKVDSDMKMMIVKDESGKEVTVYWNADTKVEGAAPSEGAMVSFKAVEKDGKMWATWVKTGETKPKM